MTRHPPDCAYYLGQTFVIETMAAETQKDLLKSAEQQGIDLTLLVKRAFDAGVQEGALQERLRVMKALQLSASDVAFSIGPPPKTKTSNDSDESAEYGLISKFARSALFAMRTREDGVSPEDITSWVQKWPSSQHVAIDQIRTALKVLVKIKEAERPARGRFKATNKLLEKMQANTAT